MYYTHFLLRFPGNLGVTAIDDILKDSKYTSNITYEKDIFNNKVIFLCVYSSLGKEKNYEKIKLQLIEDLHSINSYISIIYDTQTAEHMEFISKSIYLLERKFRTLIEIVLLNKFDVDWTEKPFYKLNKKRDRKVGRQKALEYIKNPLDELDFIALSKFIKDKITAVDEQTIFEQLQKIELRLDNILNSTSFQYEDNLVGIMKAIDDIKNQIIPKNKYITYDEIYKHLNPTIESDWEDLYEIRCLWAHNNCLVTVMEFEIYKSLYNSVIKKIDTEVTILSWFNVDEVIKDLISEDDFEIRLHMFYSGGIPICELKAKIEVNNKYYIFTKSEFTFSDLFDFYRDIFRVKNVSDYEPSLNALDINPFYVKLRDIVTAKVYELIKNEYGEDDIKKLSEILTEKKYTVNEVTKEIKTLNDDADEYLRIIFTRKNRNS